ncbi:hypothetical protein [Arhodomonas sp. AD133]|uniref:hypothetical protein n=1 Tax=Arhodomonas sp. AD133 TaxID=3415009 RepID=UPI003EB70773
MAIGIAVGYFAGREHLKYELRAAMADAWSGFSLGDPFTDDTPPLDREQPEPSASESSSASTPTIGPTLPVKLVAKEYRDMDLQRSSNPDEHIYLELQMSNALGRDLRAFRGMLVLRDMLGDTITKLRLKDNTPREAGTTWLWRGATGYNPFGERDKALRNASIDNITVSFQLQKVVYADGSSEEF